VIGFALGQLFEQAQQWRRRRLIQRDGASGLGRDGHGVERLDHHVILKIIVDGVHLPVAIWIGAQLIE